MQNAVFKLYFQTSTADVLVDARSKSAPYVLNWEERRAIMVEIDKSGHYFAFIFGERIVRLLWWTTLKKATSIFDKRSKLELFVHEFLANLGKIGSLEKVLGENPLEPLTAEHSELNKKYYDSPNSYSQAMVSFFVDPTPFTTEATITPLLPAVDMHKTDPTPNESWFFLNGIGTNEAMAKVNAIMLSDIFKRPITPLHNPTNGFKADLEEVLEGRAFNDSTPIAKSTMDQIWGELKKQEKVVVIAHSQGGLIISNVVKMLLQKHGSSPLLKKLEIYTFASAHNDFPSRKASKNTIPFSEHFANDGDFVAQVGVLNPSSQTQGDVFIRNGTGHLLNLHYLKDFDQGKYGRTSRLFTLRNGKR